MEYIAGADINIELVTNIEPFLCPTDVCEDAHPTPPPLRLGVSKRGSLWPRGSIVAVAQAESPH